MKVWLVWDKARAEHAEPPTLEAIFKTEEAAYEYIERVGANLDEFSVEEWLVRETGEA